MTLSLGGGLMTKGPAIAFNICAMWRNINVSLFPMLMLNADINDGMQRMKAPENTKVTAILSVYFNPIIGYESKYAE